MQSRRVLTAVGEVQFLRPWYLCPQCHSGQVPADVALDVEKTDLSPGVRRMLALVGSETSFDHGRQQIALFAGLEVTTKAVERTAESIGADIAGREQTAVEQALQLHLPIMVGEPIPILYVQMDGTGVPVVGKETVGRVGKVDGQPAYTREVKFGCVFIQTEWDDEGYAIRDPGSTTYTGGIEPPASLAAEFIWKPGIVAGTAPRRRWSSETEPNGSGTMQTSTFQALFRSSICFMPASTSGNWPDFSTRATCRTRSHGCSATGPNSTTARSKSWSGSFRGSKFPHRPSRKPSESKLLTLSETSSACAIPSFDASTCSSAPA